MRRGTSRVRVPDARDDVPVVAGPAGEPKRRAGRDHVQPALGIEDVAERKQVVLVRAAPVMEHEQALGVAGRGPLEEGELARASSADSVALAALVELAERPLERAHDALVDPLLQAAREVVGADVERALLGRLASPRARAARAARRRRSRARRSARARRCPSGGARPARGRTRRPGSEEPSSARVVSERSTLPPRPVEARRAARMTSMPRYPSAPTAGSPVCSPMRTRTASPSGPVLLGMRALRLHGGRDRVARAGEGEEEGVTLHVDLDPP